MNIKINKTKRVFITGTGTDVGKTYASAALVALGLDSGLTTGYYKPVQCGVDLITSETDAQKVARFSKLKSHCETGLLLDYPVSPHLALKKTNEIFDLDHIEGKLEEMCSECDLVIVEGAGGIRVPMTQDLEFGQWIAKMKKNGKDFSLLVVASPLLGTINHTLLTIDSIKSQGLEVSGFLFGRPTQDFSPLELEVLLDSAIYIENKTRVNFLGILPFINQSISYQDWPWHPLKLWLDDL